jgi:hypothetical protein
MATPGIAVPGTNVPSGSAVSPGGAQGIQGLQGVAPVAGFISKTAAYTLTTADSGSYVLCSGGSWTLTLPAPAFGLAYELRNDMGISGTTGTITVQPTGGTIDGLASLALLPQQECKLRSDGTNWRTFGLKREVILGTQDITVTTASSTVLLPAGFRLFTLDFAGLRSDSADATFYAQLSTDGGSTWLTGGGYYSQLLFNSSSGGVGTVAYSSVGQINLGGFTASAPYGMASLKLYPGGPSNNPDWLIDSVYWYVTGNYNQKMNYGGFYAGNLLATALKYYPGSGNITNLHLTVKGVV